MGYFLEGLKTTLGVCSIPSPNGIYFDINQQLMADLHNFHNLYVLRQLVESFCQAYFLYHLKSKTFELLSSRCSQLVGLPIEQLEKSPASFLELIHPQDKEFIILQYQKLISGISQEEKLDKVEFRVIYPNQKRVLWLGLAAERIDVDGQAYIGGYLENITDHKEYLYNILKFNAKKNATLEILSHDLAAPFANIEGLGNLLEYQIAEGLIEDVHKTLSYIKDNAKRGSDMIRDFVDNEFLESSQVTLNKERIDIVLRIKVLMDNYKQQQHLAAKRFELIAPSKPIFLYLDEMKFMQAINNLISNSIKFTLDNGCIKLKVDERERTVLFTVEDDGVGIPSQVQPYVFDKFTKARRIGIRGEKSVGLGMSIIKNIVEWHGGIIWFESEENRGTRVFIEIPKEGLPDR
ncbi:HAMP domain-containing histidine kinase [Pontibacter sp. BT310]|uniref:histidine kinase n=1 Tax=Pontibacter populi TaxID=890055 RepID=A0ABS6XAH0_9BACT|nr:MULTISPECIES: HAMP domain-containing sensor histidine kinase [Pontibacter]MBJ6118135.1 HAMP domain-containing histidine kinase [Pontibacter sp. BT310]MBR0570562.1 HAMP domain-containing histidine kinase [Microvirga sp. STS03]MBW3364988.1 HAMP domain-containing histidine kinase [Pontibacter populi]